MTRPILVILPSIVTGGAELQAMLQIRELTQRGVAVRLMALSDNVQPEILAGAGLPADHICQLRNPSSTLDVPFLRHLWPELRLAARFTRQHGIASVVAHLPPSHFFARLLAIRSLIGGRRLRLFQYHHSEERSLNRADTLAKRAFYAIDRLLARACDTAHWHVSQRVLDDVAGGGFTRRDATIHNTCDMASPGNLQAAEAILATVKSGGDPFVILLPGRLQARKGHHLLLSAARRLIDVYRLAPGHIQLVFAGDGPHRAEIEAAITDQDLASYVTLLGAVPHPDLLALFGKVDLVVIPSLIEGFGIVAVEALSRGALVIASDAAGLDEIIRPGQNGLQFPVGNQDALFERLAQVWDSRATPLVDRSALPAEMEARFGTAAHIDRLLTLLQG